MNKRIVVFGIVVALALLVSASIAYAQVQTTGVSWSWGGGDVITASSTDGKDHVLSLAVTVSQSGSEACFYPDIQVDRKKGGSWNVKTKIASNAKITGVSVTNCK